MSQTAKLKYVAYNYHLWNTTCTYNDNCRMQIQTSIHCLQKFANGH